jgi:hypothetical protein
MIHPLRWDILPVQGALSRVQKIHYSQEDGLGQGVWILKQKTENVLYLNLPCEGELEYRES